MTRPCRHCERAPGRDALNGLCARCWQKPGYRDLYEGCRTESPLWTAHLTKLRRLAELELPLTEGHGDALMSVRRGKFQPRKESA